MIKRMVLVLALALTPGAAMAQHHGHAKKEAAKPGAEHMNFARELIAARASLQLSAEQVTKLEAFAILMDEHHEQMDRHAKASTKSADAAVKAEHKLHTDLLAVFTEEQLVKVRPLMKAHMEKCEHMKGAKKAAGHHKH